MSMIMNRTSVIMPILSLRVKTKISFHCFMAF
jgi:hypothetical protein